MHAPFALHWKALKRVLRYLKEWPIMAYTCVQALLFILLCILDADWPGDVNDRESHFGYLLFLGLNPIS